MKHLTGDHSLCCEDWLYALKAKNVGEKYHEPETTLQPEMYQREILKVLEILNKYTSDERIIEMMHFFDTQICEAINNALTFTAPKNENFSRTRSLEYRKCRVIGTHNDIHILFDKNVLQGLGIFGSANILQLFEQLALFKINKKKTQSSFECKRVRAHRYTAQKKSDIVKQRSEGPPYVENYQVNKLVTRGRPRN